MESLCSFQVEVPTLEIMSLTDLECGMRDEGFLSSFVGILQKTL